MLVLVLVVVAFVVFVFCGVCLLLVGTLVHSLEHSMVGLRVNSSASL